MIDGNTFIFSIVGDPVAQVRLPQVMEVVFRELNMNAVWVPMHVDHEASRRWFRRCARCEISAASP